MNILYQADDFQRCLISPALCTNEERSYCGWLELSRCFAWIMVSVRCRYIFLCWTVLEYWFPGIRLCNDDLSCVIPSGATVLICLCFRMHDLLVSLCVLGNACNSACVAFHSSQPVSSPG